MGLNMMLLPLGVSHVLYDWTITLRLGDSIYLAGQVFYEIIVELLIASIFYSESKLLMHLKESVIVKVLRCRISSENKYLKV